MESKYFYIIVKNFLQSKEALISALRETPMPVSARVAMRNMGEGEASETYVALALTQPRHIEDVIQSLRIPNEILIDYITNGTELIDIRNVLRDMDDDFVDYQFSKAPQSETEDTSVRHHTSIHEESKQELLNFTPSQIPVDNSQLQMLSSQVGGGGGSLNLELGGTIAAGGESRVPEIHPHDSASVVAEAQRKSLRQLEKKINEEKEQEELDNIDYKSDDEEEEGEGDGERGEQENQKEKKSGKGAKAAKKTESNKRAAPSLLGDKKKKKIKQNEVAGLNIDIMTKTPAYLLAHGKCRLSQIKKIKEDKEEGIEAFIDHLIYHGENLFKNKMPKKEFNIFMKEVINPRMEQIKKGIPISNNDNSKSNKKGANKTKKKNKAEEKKSKKKNKSTKKSGAAGVSKKQPKKNGDMYDEFDGENSEDLGDDVDMEDEDGEEDEDGQDDEYEQDDFVDDGEVNDAPEQEEDEADDSDYTENDDDEDNEKPRGDINNRDGDSEDDEHRKPKPAGRKDKQQSKQTVDKKQKKNNTRRFDTPRPKIDLQIALTESLTQLQKKQALQRDLEQQKNHIRSRHSPSQKAKSEIGVRIHSEGGSAQKNINHNNKQKSKSQVGVNDDNDDIISQISANLQEMTNCASNRRGRKPKAASANIRAINKQMREKLKNDSLWVNREVVQEAEEIDDEQGEGEEEDGDDDSNLNGDNNDEDGSAKKPKKNNKKKKSVLKKDNTKNKPIGRINEEIDDLDDDENEDDSDFGDDDREMAARAKNNAAGLLAKQVRTDSTEAGGAPQDITADDAVNNDNNDNNNNNENNNNNNNNMMQLETET